MGKVCPDATIDALLDYIAGSDYYTVCSGSPATFADCWTNNMLAKTPVSSGSFTKADDTSGRKVTMTAATGVPITTAGSALAVALVNAAGSTVRLITTCTQQYLVAGGTVDIPAWKHNVQDPT